jgi:transposase
MSVKKLFLGMDLHKNSSTFCVKDYDGEVVASRKVATNKSEVLGFVNQFKEHNLSLAVEPVSQWYFMADILQQAGVDVHLANPLKVKAIASARVKTDKIDAGVLCDLLRGNLLPEAYLSSSEMRMWKEMVRFRMSLMKLRTQTKNRIHAILGKNGHLSKFTDTFGKAGRVWLAELELPEHFRNSLDEYLATHDYLTEQIKRAEKNIEAVVVGNKLMTLLTTIPGVSYFSALTIMAEIGDIHRFPSAKQLMGYAGVVPSTYASGDKVVHGRITKTGSRWLRWIMIEIAHKQLRCKRKPGLGWYYAKIKKNKGSKTAAVATARKLLAVIWRMLVDERPFKSPLEVREAYRKNVVH